MTLSSYLLSSVGGISKSRSILHSVGGISKSRLSCKVSKSRLFRMPSQKNMPQKPNKGHSQLRKGRISIPGAYYSVTLATFGRKPLLTTPGTPDIIFQCFDWLESDERLEWLCIMIMPDHIHAVFRLGNKQTLSALIQSFKRFTAKQINVQLAQTGSVWQENYHDHGIRHDESLNKIICYCYENPVRKGLVEQPRDYPYWRCKYEME